jgi:hypothetical protein
MKLMIDTDTAKKLTIKYEKFQAVISPLCCVPLTVACLLRLRCAALRVHATRNYRVARAAQSQIHSQMQHRCGSAAMALRFNDRPYSFIAALSQQNEQCSFLHRSAAGPLQSQLTSHL